MTKQEITQNVSLFIFAVTLLLTVMMFVRVAYALVNITVDGKHCNFVEIGIGHTAYRDCTR